MVRNIGERVAKFRREKGLSQSELAEIMGVKPATISRYETGQREVPLETGIRIARALSVTADTLFGYSVSKLFTSGKREPDLRDDPELMQTLFIIDELNDEGRRKVYQYVQDILPTYALHRKPRARRGKPSSDCAAAR